MKFIKYLILMLLLFLLAACTDKVESQGNDTPKQQEVTSQENSGNKEHTNSDRQSNNGEAAKKETVKVKKATSWEPKIKQTTYDMVNSLCNISVMTAPEYVDQDRIIFIEYGTPSFVHEFDRDNETCKVLYKSVGIGSMAILEGKLFWTEYDISKITDVEWKIKSLDLKSNKIDEIVSGKSMNNNPTPILTAGEKDIQWIQYKQDNKNVISQLMSYVIDEGKTNVIEEVKLEEDAERDGDYLIVQKTVDDNQTVVYKSSFKANEKRFDLSLYEDDKPKLISTQANMLDFDLKNNYFAYGTDGKFVVENLDTDQEMVYSVDRTTTDSPIFIDDKTVLFRRGMNEILMLDLEKNEYVSLTDYQNTISKPIYTNGLLSYAVFDFNENNEVELHFNVIDFE